MIYQFVTNVATFFGKSSRIASVGPEEAKRVVLRYAERSKINITWMAGKIGSTKQNVSRWFSGENEPADKMVWVRMAQVLGVIDPITTEVLDMARELALDVLVESQNEDMKRRAANLIREISKKSPAD